MEPTQLIESFYQGPRGNCVSIACIKAAIAKWGSDKVFETYQDEPDGGFSYKMRDGFASRVRIKELNKARDKSGFAKGDDEVIRGWAHKYFAAMAKRVLVEGEVDVFFSLGGFNAAIKSLNNGEGYYEGIKWLGLIKNNNKINGLSSLNPIVAASNPHCFFVWNGFYDRYGDAMPLSKITEENEAFISRFQLEII